MKAIDLIESGEKIFQKLFILLGALCLLGIVGTVLMNVVMRFVFNIPMMWYLEFCSILVVWLAFALIGLNCLLDKHFAIDTFTRMLPKALLPLQRFIADAASLACVIMLSMASAEAIAVNGNMTLTTVPVNLTVSFYMPVSIGAATYIMVLVLRYVKLALGGKKEVEGK